MSLVVCPAITCSVDEGRSTSPCSRGRALNAKSSSSTSQLSGIARASNEAAISVTDFGSYRAAAGLLFRGVAGLKVLLRCGVAVGRVRFVVYGQYLSLTSETGRPESARLGTVVARGMAQGRTP
jgi:hypothetical protein